MSVRSPSEGGRRKRGVGGIRWSTWCRRHGVRNDSCRQADSRVDVVRETSMTTHKHHRNDRQPTDGAPCSGEAVWNCVACTVLLQPQSAVIAHGQANVAESTATSHSTTQ